MNWKKILIKLCSKTQKKEKREEKDSLSLSLSHVIIKSLLFIILQIDIKKTINVSVERVFNNSLTKIISDEIQRVNE